MNFSGGSVKGFVTFFGQSHTTILSHIYKIMLKQKESEINQFLKEEQIMVCSSPVGKSENLKKICQVAIYSDSVHL